MPHVRVECVVRSDSDLRQSARAVLEAHWRPEGYTCPNATTYPWLWLWDSCFHAVVWAELGDADRAATELGSALSGIDDDGFVPHLGYLAGGAIHADFWGRVPDAPRLEWSSITQPPVYGWAAAELLRRGVRLDGSVVDAAAAGLRFLLTDRARSPSGLVQLVHPWESGCDHSPRWDDLMAPESAGSDVDPYDEERWFARKGELLATVERSPGGAPLHNAAFPVGSVAFTAICAWSARELAAATGDRGLAAVADGAAAALEERWDRERHTWVDDGPTAEGSGRIRTAEALLPVLVDHRPDVVDAVVAALTEPGGFGAPYGPWGVDPREPTFRRGSYWRGPSWPQIDLLLWWGLRSAGRADAAAALAAGTRSGAVRSGWAEYWDADTASAGGAAPQSWTTVAVLMPARNETA
jgi:hypothetical protein